MQKAEIQLKQFMSFLPRIGTSDLEKMMMRIKSVLEARKEPDPEAKEAMLLEKLYAHAFSKEKAEQYENLGLLRYERDLTSEEQKVFLNLINEELELQTERIKIIGELAELKGVSIKEMAGKLGIKPPASV